MLAPSSLNPAASCLRSSERLFFLGCIGEAVFREVLRDTEDFCCRSSSVSDSLSYSFWEKELCVLITGSRTERRRVSIPSPLLQDTESIAPLLGGWVSVILGFCLGCVGGSWTSARTVSCLGCSPNSLPCMLVVVLVATRCFVSSVGDGADMLCLGVASGEAVSKSSMSAWHSELIALSCAKGGALFFGSTGDSLGESAGGNGCSAERFFKVRFSGGCGLCLWGLGDWETLDFFPIGSLGFCSSEDGGVEANFKNVGLVSSFFLWAPSVASLLDLDEEGDINASTSSWTSLMFERDVEPRLGGLGLVRDLLLSNVVWERPKLWLVDERCFSSSWRSLKRMFLLLYEGALAAPLTCKDRYLSMQRWILSHRAGMSVFISCNVVVNWGTQGWKHKIMAYFWLFQVCCL